MCVGVSRFELRRAAQMFNGIVQASHFIERAPKIEMCDDVIWFKLDCGAKSCMCILHFASLEVDTANINVRLAPVRLNFDHLLVNANRFIESSGPRLTPHRVFKQLIRRARMHLVNRCGSACMKGKYELARQWLYRVADGVGRNRGDFAPARKQTKLVNRRVDVCTASLQCCDSPKEFARWNMAVGYLFYGAERHKVREIIKMRAPA